MTLMSDDSISSFENHAIFLWGYLKFRVYANSSRAADDLKDNIQAEIDNIPTAMHVRSWKMPEKAASVYGQLRTPPNGYGFQNYVNKNCRYVSISYSKNLNFLIHPMCFIAISKKEVMLVHPVF